MGITDLEEPQTQEIQIIPKLKSLGYFEATAYTIDTCGKSPNHPAYGITASGKKAISGKTIAVDPTVIKLGTILVIEGVEYIAEDTGGAIKGNRIDICYNSVEEALQFGRKVVEVFVYE